MRGVRRTHDAARRADLRQARLRHTEEVQQLGVPGSPFQVVEQGAARVRVVGDERGARREPVDEPGIDGAEHGLAGLGPCAKVRHVLEQPLDLGSREVGIPHQAGAVGDVCVAQLGAELAAALRGAAVLPDEGAMQRRTARAVPRNHGLALVGDPYPRRRLTALIERLAGDLERDAPDLLRIMLHHAGRREVLRELSVGPRQYPPIGGDHQRRGARGSLIQRENGWHSPSRICVHNAAATGLSTILNAFFIGSPVRFA